MFKNYSFLVKEGSFISWLLIFYFFDHAFNLNFRLRHYVYIMILLFFGVVLAPLYYISEIYDKILHLIMPIFLCAIIFYVVNKSEIEFKYKLAITFAFAVCGLTILEIEEYIFDLLWDSKLQGVYARDVSGIIKYDLVLDKNDDTMLDLIAGMTGSLLFIVAKTVIFHYKKFKKRIKE